MSFKNAARETSGGGVKTSPCGLGLRVMTLTSIHVFCLRRRKEIPILPREKHVLKHAAVIAVKPVFH